MPGFRSSSGYVGFLKQTVKGTGIVPTKFCRLAAAESFEQIQDVQEVRSLNADRELDAIYKTAHKPGGSFQTFIRPDLGAVLLAYALGSDTVTGTADPYTHTIKKANTIPWVSIERQLDIIERVADCKINQLVISGESGKPVLLDVAYMGIDSAIVTTATASYETAEPFMFHNGAYTLNSGAITIISAFTITINNSPEEIFTTSFKRDDILEGPFDIEVTMRLKFEAGETLYKAVLYGGGSALVDTLGGGNFIVDLTHTAGTREFKLEIPALKHLAIAKHLDPETKAVYLDLRSKPIKSASEIITGTCKNATATAYI